ncbi:MAG: three-Cys-motif partner protein TcmP [Flavihumibacter sp.]
MNQFGGNWTENKIEIIVEYAKAYLAIMNVHAAKNNWKLLYFDGFAGSGFIKNTNKENQKTIVGAAKRVLDITAPRSFDEYYFVEKDVANADSLKDNTQQAFPDKKIHIANTDCNEKILSMSRFLLSDKGKNYKVLAFIDPCGMQLNWHSLEALQQRSVDVWVLVPTGMGVNRLLKKDSKISDAWVAKLETFLGMTKEEILAYFYKEKVSHTLFGEELSTSKEEKAVEKSALLYKERLAELFKFVSEPYVLKNKSNAVLFHFFMASNNQSAVKIANDIIKKFNKLD